MKYCPQCNSKMQEEKLKKGGFYKRAMLRWICKCGHSEAQHGIDNSREEAIAEGLLDDEIGIPKYPDAQ